VLAYPARSGFGCKGLVGLAFKASMTIKYVPSTGFQKELTHRVEEYFRSNGLRKRDLPQMYFKTAVIFFWCAASYWLLVFHAGVWYEALPLCVSLGLGVAAIGFNIQHDGSHGAYSNHRAINFLMAATLDLIGGSSYIWRVKHNFIHHNYPNLVGVDTDIDLAPLGRLPFDRRLRGIHRFQFLYLWFFYGFLAVKWQFFDDFRDLFQGKVGQHRFRALSRRDLAQFFIGKVLAACTMFIIPAAIHPFRIVCVYYFATSFVLGLTLSVVFQLAHCVEGSRFTDAPEATVRLDTEWAIQQIETTVDFARENRLLTWYVGGLNFQIEHHLFPKICHLHYPALAPIVEQVCGEFGIRYRANETMLRAVASHYRFLRGSESPLV
jgi:linoleoyl-CoA desaturase